MTPASWTAVAGCMMRLGRDGVLHCTLAAVDGDDLAAARSFLRSVVVLGGGPQTPVALHLVGCPSPSQAERLAVLASTEAAAVGVVIDEDGGPDRDAQQSLAERLVALVQARCPSRVFARRADAGAWLRSFAAPA